MRWEKIKLEEIVKLTKGKKHSEVDDTNAYRYLQIEDLHGSGTDKYTNEDGVICDPSDLLIAWDGANAGKVGTGLHGMAGSTLARISVTADNVSSKYLYWYLSSNFEVIKSKRTGATIPHVNGSELRSMLVPLPPLHIQEQIADTLDKADALRRKDQELLQKYDELAQSIFYDMFGDPVRNEKGWDVKMFSEVGSLDRGVSKHRPRNAPELLGGKYPLIQTGDVSNCKGYIINYTQTYSELGYKQSKLWPKGTLCITIAANIAKTGILTFDACFPDSVVGFIPNNLVQTNYVRFWLSHLQKSLEDSAPESAQKNINLDILRKLRIPVPPKGLQDHFEDILREVRKKHELSNQNIEKSKTLFETVLENKVL